MTKEYGDTGGLDARTIAIQSAALKLKSINKRWNLIKNYALTIYSQSFKHGTMRDELVIDYLVEKANEFLDSVEKEINKGSISNPPEPAEAEGD